MAAKDTAIVTSAADNGAYRRSTIFPCIFEIIKEEEEWENDCCIICIAIKPGARKITNGTPSTFPLSDPIARDSTNKKSKDEISGENNV